MSVRMSDLRSVSFVPGTTQSVLFLITPTALSTYRNTVGLYDNQLVVPNADVQDYFIDTQWYTFNSLGNEIAEQLQDCFTYWLKTNRLNGHVHVITLISKNTQDSAGIRFFAVRNSASNMLVWGGYGASSSGSIKGYSSAMTWNFTNRVTISKY